MTLFTLLTGTAKDNYPAAPRGCVGGLANDNMRRTMKVLGLTCVEEKLQAQGCNQVRCAALWLMARIKPVQLLYPTSMLIMCSFKHMRSSASVTLLIPAVAGKIRLSTVFDPTH